VAADAAANNYFSAVLTDWNLPFTVVPRLLTAAMMATLRPAAIIAYSIEVAPDSSEKNRKTTRTDSPPGRHFTGILPGFGMELWRPEAKIRRIIVMN
jgi:hypothetical protein